MDNPFDAKIVDRLCALLQAEKTATAEGNADRVMLCRANYEGFVDALKMILSAGYCERLLRRAIENVNGKEAAPDGE